MTLNFLASAVNWVDRGSVHSDRKQIEVDLGGNMMMFDKCDNPCHVEGII